MGKRLTEPQLSIINMLEYTSNPAICNLGGRLTFHSSSHQIKQAIQSLIAENDMLRTRVFRNDDGTYYQEVSSGKTTIEEYEFQSVSEADLFLDQFIQMPFEIPGGCLYRFATVKAGDKQFLFLCVHHLLADATALYVIIDAIRSIVEAGDTDNVVFPGSYDEFFEGEQKYFNSRKYCSDQEYWEKTYQDLPSHAMLCKKKTTLYDTEAVRKTFPAHIKLGDAIAGLCSRNSVTAYEVVAAALTFYLGYVNGNKEDVVLGSVAANRRKKEFHIIGMCTSVLPLRFDLDYDRSFDDYTSEIRKVNFQSLRHQKYPYRHIMEYVNSKHGISKLFDVLISYQTKSIISSAKDIELEWRFNGFCETDLNLHIVDREDTDELLWHFDYKKSSYTEIEVDQIYSHLSTIILCAAATPGILLKDLKAIGDDERLQLLNMIGKTLPQRAEQALHEIIAARVRLEGKNIACVCSEMQLSYDQLWKQSGYVAYALKERGIGPGDKVGILTGRNCSFISALVGILRAGCAYVPMDETHPVDRLQYILDNCSAKAVIVKSAKFGFLGLEELDIAALDTPGDTCCHAGSGEDAAYVLYTSGSTGNPKGVQVTHANVINLTDGLVDEIYSKYGRHQRLGLLASFCFDASVQQIYAALFEGHTLYLIPDKVKRDGTKLLNYLKEYDITVTDGTPSHLRMLTDSNSMVKTGLSIKHMLIGGETLSVKLMEDFFQEFGESMPEVTNVYGPTETCVDSTFYHVSVQEIKNRISVPIGKPIHNSIVYILNEAGEPVPYGVPGEIYIGGAGVSDGYIGLSQQTRASFLDDPFRPGRRVYRTGDMGRWLSDGNIEFIGRTDGQVKLRGYRIELGEIEAQLEKLEGIRRAAVIIDGETDKRLCAYLVSDLSVSPSEIRELLVKVLPGYMVPDVIMVLDEFPMNRSGKIDKKALPKIKSDRVLREYELPETQTEQTLVGIWQEILSKETIGVMDGFFDLGGNSLNTALLLTRIYKEFDVEIPWEFLFQNATIRQTGEYLSKAVKKEFQAITPAEEKTYYMLSSTQKRMYLTQQIDNTGIANNIPVILKLDGLLDWNKMKAAIDAVIERHESLRTTFVMHEGQIVQRINQQVTHKTPHRKINKQELDNVIRNFIQPFPLDNLPVIRTMAVDTQCGEHYLLIDMHHIISDGVSLAIILDEICALYEGDLPKKVNLQYKDFCEWQSMFVQTEAYQKQEQYWLHELKSASAIPFPADYPRTERQSFSGATIYKEFSREQVKQISGICREADITLFMFLLSGYALLLSRYTGSNDIIIGVPAAARTHEDLQEIVGYFVNMLPVRINVDPDMSLANYFHAVKEKALCAYENQDYLFEHLLNQNENASQFFRTSMTYTSFRLDRSLDSGLRITEHYPDYPIAKFDLALNIIDGKENLLVALSYAIDLFKAVTADTILSQLCSLLEQMQEEGTRTVGQLLAIGEVQQEIADAVAFDF